MTDTLLEFATQQLEAAKLIAQRGDEIMPVMIVDGADPAIVGIPQYGNPEYKEFLRAQLAAFLKECGGTRYAIVMEAWLGMKSGRVADDYLPSKDPKRLEAVVVTAVQDDGQKIGLMAEIKRVGKMITFADTVTMDSAIGPLSELFGTGLPN